MHDVEKGLATKLRIVCAIDRPIDEMTVSEICQKAGVSRQTFYNHFESKDELLPWWGIWCDTHYLAQIGRTYSWEEGFLRSTYVFRWGSSFLTSGLGHGDAIPYLGAHPVAQYNIEAFTETVRLVTGKEPDDILAYDIRSFAHFESENVIDSCRRGMAVSPLIGAKQIVSMVPALLYDAIQLPSAKDKTQLENLAAMDKLDEELQRTFDPSDVINQELLAQATSGL